MYRIVEIFDSVQSEGTHAGTSAVFIRFYGCNLQCVFGETSKCDEPLHTQQSAIEKMNLSAVINRVRGSARHVVITGGEPTLQDLGELIKALHAVGKYVQVETNGTNIHNIRGADWITYSPKFTWDDKAPKLQSGFHELKLLAGPMHIPDGWATVKNKFVQPIAYGEELDLVSIRWCHNWVVNNPTWKLSLQSHKWYGAE